jgi:hypothetical protein
MGYHVILRSGKQEIEHYFVKHFHELADLAISEDSIIYEGEEKWKPELVAQSDRFRQLSEIRVRSSMLAEQLFKKQARRNKLIVEDINQDQESFGFYYNAVPDKMIKRGDFLIRNVRNIEIEVKCKTFFRENKSPVFFIEEKDLEKHSNMQEITQSPVIFAIYQRCKVCNRPLKDELYMMDVNYMKKYIREHGIVAEKRHWGSGYPIEVRKCLKKFDLIRKYQRGLIT